MSNQTEVMRARVLPFALKMSKDEELIEDISRGAQAKNYVRRSPAIVLLDLKRVFGKELANMPVPDSEGGNNPDRYPIEGSKRKGSFYNDLFREFSWGKDIQHKLDQIKLAKDANTEDEAEEPYASMNPVELTEAEDTLKKDFTYGAGVIKNSMALYFKLEELKTLPLISVQLKADAEGSMTGSPKPYIIRSADVQNEPDQYRTFSCDTVIKIDVAKVQKNGGTFKALLASLKRDKGDAAKIEVPAFSLEQSAPYAERFGQMLDKAVSTDGGEARLIQYLASEQGEDALIWYGRVEKYLAQVMASAGLKVKYAKLEAELDDAKANAA